MIKKSEFKNTSEKKPAKQVGWTIIILSTLLVIVCGILTFKYGYRFFYTFFVTFLMAIFHVLIRGGTPRILLRFHKKSFNPDNWWFKEKSWEKTFYKLTGVKNWKDKLITIDPETFSVKKNSLESIIQTMCFAEVLHEITGFLSLFSIAFGFVFGGIWIFVVINIFFAVWESRFVMAQRYNRSRIMRIINKRNDRINRSPLTK